MTIEWFDMVGASVIAVLVMVIAFCTYKSNSYGLFEIFRSFKYDVAGFIALLALVLFVLLWGGVYWW